MRIVNKAYDLPDPASWHTTVIHNTNEAIARLKGVFIPQIVRVSHKHQSQFPRIRRIHVVAATYS